jgi:predicted Rossmann fold flavoprotein
MKMRYNSAMMKVKTLIVGGGAAGLYLATTLKDKSNILLVERGERLGRKLAATGNGQGNVTNVHLSADHYFTFENAERKKIEGILTAYGYREKLAFLESLGGLFTADERGRVYPTSRQASAVTDLLRFEIERSNVNVMLSSKVTRLQKTRDGFIVKLSTPDGEKEIQAQTVVLCAGGKAAKNFGTDGTGYDLATSLGHTLTPLYPSLVQLKTDAKETKTLKGIRVMDACVRACKGEKELARMQGDVIFTEYGISGDVVFRLSSFISKDAEKGDVRCYIDFIPEISAEKLTSILERKQRCGKFERSELLCGILNNQVGRLVMKRSGTIEAVVKNVKNFCVTVTGTLGYDYAQVTQGGVKLSELDENLQSKKVSGLYFAGEIIDVDGECGGYNLQWAYSSAATVAAAINGQKKE